MWGLAGLRRHHAALAPTDPFGQWPVPVSIAEKPKAAAPGCYENAPRRRGTTPKRRAMAATTKGTSPRWEFKARFRRHGFGWRSQPAILRLRQAVSETRQAARRDPVTGAEGCKLLSY